MHVVHIYINSINIKLKFFCYFISTDYIFIASALKFALTDKFSFGFFSLHFFFFFRLFVCKESLLVYKCKTQTYFIVGFQYTFYIDEMILNVSEGSFCTIKGFQQRLCRARATNIQKNDFGKKKKKKRSLDIICKNGIT